MTNFLLCLIAASLWMIGAPDRDGRESSSVGIMLSSMFLAAILWGGLLASIWGYGEFSGTVTAAGGIEPWIEDVLAESAELAAVNDAGAGAGADLADPISILDE